MIDGLRTGLRHRLRRAMQRTEAQHRHLRSLLCAAEDAARAGAPSEAPVSRLRESLRAHFELEEGIAFPALHGLEPAAQPELVRLIAEHHRVLEELAGLLAGEPDTASRLLRLGVALRDHEQREENLIARLLGPDVTRRA